MLSTNFQKIISATLICTAAILIGTVIGVLQIPEVQAGEEIEFTPDHYFGYKVFRKTIPEFDPFPMTLTDQFESQFYSIFNPKMMFNPAEKNQEIVTDTETHLIRYKITGFHTPVLDIVLTNQFETLVVNTKKVHSILVPTAKSHEGPPDLLIDIPVDHFKCYKLQVTDRVLGPVGKKIRIFDTNFEEVRKVKVFGRPLLCNPVEKFDAFTGEQLSTIKNPDVHLTCYQVKPKARDQGHDRIRFDTNNQIAPEDLKTKIHDILKENGKFKNRHQLCVPTLKDSLPSP